MVGNTSDSGSVCCNGLKFTTLKQAADYFWSTEFSYFASPDKKIKAFVGESDDDYQLRQLKPHIDREIKKTKNKKTKANAFGRYFIFYPKYLHLIHDEIIKLTSQEWIEILDKMFPIRKNRTKFNDEHNRIIKLNKIKYIKSIQKRCKVIPKQILNAVSRHYEN